MLQGGIWRELRAQSGSKTSIQTTAGIVLFAEVVQPRKIDGANRIRREGKVSRSTASIPDHGSAENQRHCPHPEDRYGHGEIGGELSAFVFDGFAGCLFSGFRGRSSLLHGGLHFCAVGGQQLRRFRFEA